MATIKPFKAIRPVECKVSSVAALPYDVVNREEAKEIVSREPNSFLKIDRAEVQFDDFVNAYDEKVYLKAKNTLDEMISEGIYQSENKNCYYIYQLIMNGRKQTGIVACASVDEYMNNIIKKHEKTREEKELDRIRHVEYCNAQTGPIFLAYRDSEEINKTVEEIMRNDAPIYDFLADDDVRHTVWIINNSDKVNTIKSGFENINDIYIADGHHRTASAVKVGLQRREKSNNYTGDEEFNYFLSVLFPHSELEILSYNRVVKDLNGHTVEEFLDKVSQNFEVKNRGADQYQPSSKSEFGMYLDNNWYSLKMKKAVESNDPVEKLDVSILQDNLLSPVLGIDDPRRDSRIDFIGGIRGLDELEKRVNTDMKIAFSMYPTSLDELFLVADEDKLMPPKSTWFEPKLRSGIFIHSLD